MGALGEEKGIRKTEWINVANIKMDSHPINPSTLSLVDHIRSGGSIPPIKVKLDPNGTFVIKDGRHRVTTYKLLGLDKIKATYSTKRTIQ